MYIYHSPFCGIKSLPEKHLCIQIRNTFNHRSPHSFTTWTSQSIAALPQGWQWEMTAGTWAAWQVPSSPAALCHQTLLIDWAHADAWEHLLELDSPTDASLRSRARFYSTKHVITAQITPSTVCSMALQGHKWAQLRQQTDVPWWDRAPTSYSPVNLSEAMTMWNEPSTSLSSPYPAPAFLSVQHCFILLASHTAETIFLS